MYAITSFIKEGQKDKLAIKQLQALLNFLGEGLIVDGDFGSKSTKAVKQFQEKKRLSVDGKVGEKSWLKLYQSTLIELVSLQEKNDFFEILSLNSSNSTLILYLQSIFYLIDNKTKTTTIFDDVLESSVLAFQASNCLEASGCVSIDVWQKLFESLKRETKGLYALFLTDEIITQKAKENNLSPAAVKAVIKVESKGRGFQTDKKLVILFEGHIFWSQLKDKGINPHNFVKNNEDVLYPYSTYDYYGVEQYSRLEKAKKIDKTSALKSASWGMFQVMGFNYKSAGFDTVEEMIASFEINEEHQLDAFFTFLKNENILKYLQAKDWAKFAYRYNGSKYKKNQYDSKLQKAYHGSILAKSIGGMNEKTLTSLYSKELEEAFLEFSDKL